MLNIWKRIWGLCLLTALVIATLTGCESAPVGTNRTYYNSYFGVSIHVPGTAKLDSLSFENARAANVPMTLADLELSEDGIAAGLLHMSQTTGMRQTVESMAWVHVYGQLRPELDGDLSALADLMRAPTGEREGIAFTLLFDGQEEADGHIFHRFTYEMLLTDNPLPLLYEVHLTKGATEGSFLIIETSYGGTEASKDAAEALRGHVKMMPLAE